MRYNIPGTAKYVPIKFMDKSGTVGERPTSTPVIMAALRYDTENFTGPRMVSIKRSWALLDTGAENNYATPDLIQAAGCPQIGTAKIAGATSTIVSPHHHCKILFPEVGLQLNTDVFAVPLAEQERHFPLIIGMLSIRQCRLVMDFKAEVYRLYIE